VNVAVPPTSTVWFCGWVVIDGATVAAVIVNWAAPTVTGIASNWPS
jgi:hypothetical protein